MTKHKYVGLDVHQATTSIAVLDSNGKLLSQSTIQTSSREICNFIRALSGTVHLTFEEGTQAVWLYDLIKPLVAESIVCIHGKTTFSSPATKPIASTPPNSLSFCAQAVCIPS